MFKTCFNIKDDSQIMLKYTKRYSNPQNMKNSQIYCKVLEKRSLRSAKSLNHIKTSQLINNIPINPIKYNHKIISTNVKHPKIQHLKHNYQQQKNNNFHLIYLHKEIYSPQNIKLMKSSSHKKLNLYKEIQFQFMPQRDYIRQSKCTKSDCNSVPMIKISEAPDQDTNLCQKQFISRVHNKNQLSLSLIKQEQQNMLSTHFSEFERNNMKSSMMLVKSTVSMISSKSPTNSIIIQRSNQPQKLTKLL